MSDIVNKNLKAALVRQFFGISFREIRNHHAFYQLKLTDDEIIDNRNEIKAVLESQTKCSTSSRFCQSLEPHYILRRNQDNQLIIDTEECKKAKDYKSLSEESINKRIKKYLITENYYTFTNQEVIRSVQILEKTLASMMKPVIDNLGNSDYLSGNQYFCVNNQQKKAIYNLFTFHYILIGKKVSIIKSQELKELYLKKGFNLYNKEDSNKSELNWSSVTEPDLLIVLDLGLESSSSKMSYYLDAIPDLFQARNSKGKTTHVLTPVQWELIFQDLSENKNYVKKESPELEKIKLQELNNTMKELFPIGI